MSQQYNNTTKKTKRATRTQRTRPVLVTANDEQGNLVEEQVPEVESAPVTTEPVASATPKRRLPAFFSTVGKRDTAEEAVPEKDIAQARLARATRGKAATQATKGSAASQDKPKETKPAAKPAASRTPERPPSLFKTRYIIGMGIYLIAANFLGIYERDILRNMGAERTLSQFNLFGLPVVITTSTVLFLITLIVILVVLARFDLLPRSLGAATNSTGSTRSSTNREGGDGTRQIPPTKRQGEPGEHDDLYQAYRSQQRREKKR